MGDTFFSGNKSGNNSSDAISISKATVAPTVNLNGGNGGYIIFNDAINIINSASSSDIFKFNINKDITYDDMISGNNYVAPTDGIVVLNNELGGKNNQNSLVTIHNGTFRIGENGKFRNNVSLSMAGGTLDTQNGIITKWNKCSTWCKYNIKQKNLGYIFINTIYV